MRVRFDALATEAFQVRSGKFVLDPAHQTVTGTVDDFDFGGAFGGRKVLAIGTTTVILKKWAIDLAPLLLFNR